MVSDSVLALYFTHNSNEESKKKKIVDNREITGFVKDYLKKKFFIDEPTLKTG